MTPTASGAIKVRFRAEIAWLGPIMGAVPDARDRPAKIQIAGAEDPALGKSFAASLVPVTESHGHFHACKPEIWSRDAYSDVYGWFNLSPLADLWQHGAKGVLLVLVYNQSPDLAYYTYHDYDPDARLELVPTRRKTSSTQGRMRLIPSMPEDMKRLIDGAIAEAVDELLRDQKAKDLRKALAELPSEPAPQNTPDSGTRALASGKELVFAIGSCQYPTAMLEHVVSGASYARLGKRLDAGDSPRPQCALLVGDQIYVDGTAGLFDPTSQFDRHVRPYELLFCMDSVRDVLRRLPAFMMLDDHEILNNWEPRVDDARPDPAMVDGRRSYEKFERRAGPDLRSAVWDSRKPMWYSFEVNGFPLFMADTRTERTARTARTIESARIMSIGQHAALLRWLHAQPADVPKIIASPAILLPRHARTLQRGQRAGALRSDAWDGFPRSLHRVLGYIAKKRIPNVVFVSGDEHLGCVARIEVAWDGHDPIVIHSVHSSPLFAPFPFANAKRADFVAAESFKFPSEHAGPFHCTVDTEFGAPGDGFLLLRFYRDGGAWTMECDFDREVKVPPLKPRPLT
jgi:cholesterol oxidase